MEVEHVIVIQNKPHFCKFCKRDVLITPVNLEGEWTCPYCNKVSKLFSKVYVELEIDNDN